LKRLREGLKKERKYGLTISNRPAPRKPCSFARNQGEQSKSDSSEKIGELIERAGRIPSDEILQEIKKEHKNLKQAIDTFKL
jgi:hypothetical protein